MKFKYKKIILLITMCTMGIGMVTISLTSPSNYNSKKTSAEEDSPFVDISENASLINDAGLEGKSEFKHNNEEINQLVALYFNGMLTCDLQSLGKIVTEVENIDVEEMQAKQKLIEAYENLECYTLEGRGKGEYLVYAYYELKFTGIDTPAPGLTRLYIVTEEDGAKKIELGLIKQEVQDFIDEADESEDVKQIIQTVNTKLEEAVNKDVKLREFYSSLNGGSDEVDTDIVEEEGTDTSAQPTETDQPMENTETVNE